MFMHDKVFGETSEDMEIQTPYDISINSIYRSDIFYRLSFIQYKAFSEIIFDKQSQKVKFHYSKLLIEKIYFAQLHCLLVHIGSFLEADCCVVTLA